MVVLYEIMPTSLFALEKHLTQADYWATFMAFVRGHLHVFPIDLRGS